MQQQQQHTHLHTNNSNNSFVLVLWTSNKKNEKPAEYIKWLMNE